jgi:hypothetical protein
MDKRALALGSEQHSNPLPRNTVACIQREPGKIFTKNTEMFECLHPYAVSCAFPRCNLHCTYHCAIAFRYMSARPSSKALVEEQAGRSVKLYEGELSIIHSEIHGRQHIAKIAHAVRMSIATRQQQQSS